MKKWLRRAVRTLAAVIGILLILWTIVFVYFRTHKKQILEKTITAVQKNVSGTATISDIGLDFPSTFPYLSVELENVVIHDSLYQQHHHELLRAKSLYLQVNPFTLLTGKFSISRIVLENGSMFIFDDGNYSNLQAIKKPAPGTESKQQDVNVSAIKLVNMRAIFQKKVFNKLYDINFINTTCKIRKTDDHSTFKIDLEAFANTIAFNTNKGSFAEKKRISGDFELEFVTASKLLTINDIVLRIDKDPYRFNGKFNFAGERSFHLEVKAPKANFAKAAALLPMMIRRNFDSVYFDKPINAEAVIDGFLIPGNKAAVKVDWTVKDATIQSNFGKFEQASFTGFFYNKVSDTMQVKPENSIIQLNNFKANWQDVSLESKSISVSNFVRPILQCDLKANADLTAINNLAAPETFQFNKGKIDVDVKYSGAIYDSATDAPSINGFAKITDGWLVYGPRQIQFEQFNGELIFSGTDVLFKDITTLAQGNKLSMNIRGDNLLTLMNSDPSKATLNVSVSSSQIDIAKFTSFIGSRTKTATKKSNVTFKKATSKIDRLLDQCSIQLFLDASNIKFRRFTASAVKSTINLNNETWGIHNTSFRHAGGLVTLDGELKGGSKDYNPISIKATLDGLDISKVFYAFNNFNLSSLNDKNLRGKLYSNINLTGAVLEKAELVPSSLKGNISLSLKQGELNNFEPLANMSVFLLKNRDFSSINFSEINNRFDFNGSMVYINRMEIQSNVLSLFMEGLYDIAGKATNLQIQVPLSNLKKRNPDEIPSKKGVKKNAGISIYVNAKSNDKGDIDFSYGLFNKRIKKK